MIKTFAYMGLARPLLALILSFMGIGAYKTLPALVHYQVEADDTPDMKASTNDVNDCWADNKDHIDYDHAVKNPSGPLALVCRHNNSFHSTSYGWEVEEVSP